jgi:hypothetical protein
VGFVRYDCSGGPISGRYVKIHRSGALALCEVGVEVVSDTSCAATASDTCHVGLANVVGSISSSSASDAPNAVSNLHSGNSGSERLLSWLRSGR